MNACGLLCLRCGCTRSTCVSIATSSWLNTTGSQYCGRRRQCLEVQCRDGTFTDFFGNSYERTGVCNGAAETLSVKVKIVDT